MTNYLCTSALFCKAPIAPTILRFTDSAAPHWPSPPLIILQPSIPFSQSFRNLLVVSKTEKWDAGLENCRSPASEISFTNLHSEGFWSTAGLGGQLRFYTSHAYPVLRPSMASPPSFGSPARLTWDSVHVTAHDSHLMTAAGNSGIAVAKRSSHRTSCLTTLLSEQDSDPNCSCKLRTACTTVVCMCMYMCVLIYE